MWPVPDQLRLWHPTRTTSGIALFNPQGNHRIDTRSATRRNKAGQTCDDQQNERHRGGSWHICGSETVEQCSHRARRDRRQNQADAQPCKRQCQAALAEGEQYLAGRRTQCCSRRSHWCVALSRRRALHTVRSTPVEARATRMHSITLCSASASTVAGPRSPQASELG